MSTLCAGCGHDAISAAIIHACFELSLPPHRVAKLSGIGCSSKSPTYILGRPRLQRRARAHAVRATGALLANQELIRRRLRRRRHGVSIGMGQYAHLMRRNVRMVYIVENNGVYGLTKGQFSATADRGSTSKRTGPVEQPIDSRGRDRARRRVRRPQFSGDKAQLRPLLQAAFEHRGAACIDVITPCVTFNNHDGSTKSFDYVREHNIAVNALDVILGREQIEVDYAEGAARRSRCTTARRLCCESSTPITIAATDTVALATIERHRVSGEIVTGLVYVNDDADELHDILNTTTRPLNELSASANCARDRTRWRDQHISSR